MDFLAVFAVTLCMTVGLCLALLYGKPPTYRPRREEILHLLNAVITQQASVDQWTLFLALPITHDPDLEAIRVSCIALDEGTETVSAAHQGLNGAIYDRAGMERLQVIYQRLEKLIEAEPVSRWF
ncbi:hypothetical protein [Neptuniibacter sp. CAU 1671]|uniref:hypothetical protein n=1 Tax=Neptuniibacter sp. CAU 1671 TaxID=3032593 RepID=UPI0023DC55D7|nr:hypothetical protein [Neptuniibacter sp. CAU 1671]MDF2181599.1 hypothetical protein [Neptuniibacter sp. CAU 1671]